MRVAIRHTTHYSYDAAASFAVQRLRLTPRDSRAQTVRSWAIETKGIEHAAEYIDGFGNHVHLVTHCKPYEELTITASGEVDTTDNGGVVGDTGEVANPSVFLRGTPLTAISPEIAALANECADGTNLGRLHRLLEAVAKRVVFDTDATVAATTAAEALKAGHGVCQDHAHIFIAAARHLGIPARYVTGYLYLDDEAPAVAHHAWAEAHVGGLGWIGFDAANDICPTDRYIRLACGFDAASAAPIAGTRRGGGSEALSVDVIVQQQQQQQ